MYTATPEQLKQSQRALQKAFTRDDLGFSQLLHAQLYLKYIDLYVYYMKEGINKFLPEPQNLIKPKGIEYDIVDEMVKVAVNHCGSHAAKLETNTYHAKVLRLEDAEQIVSLEEDLNLGELPKTIMPYEIAKTAIIECPDHIAVIDCVCRKVRGDEGCKPYDVCLVIGEPWVTWALERNHNVNGRLITKEEALKILKETDERGNVHAGFFKDIAAGRLYSICNCCPCCCTALLSQNYLTAPMMAGSGYIARIDYDKCKGCGICEKKCNFLAIYRDKDNKVTVNEDLCRGCEACAKFCKSDAISFELVDPNVLAPLDIKALKAQQAQNA